MDKYQQIRYDWEQVMWGIGRKEVAYFEEDNLFYLDSIIFSNLRRSIMVWVYNDLVQAKKIDDVGRLDIEVKESMWATVKEICAGKTDDKQKMAEIAKALYVIEYFLNEKQ